MIIKVLTEEFAKHDLKLVFKQIDTSELDRLLEFLDVLHVNDQTAKGGFITKHFTKKTALNRCFLNGSSHHPLFVYKSIIFGEAVELRRLNEKQEHYLESLECLKEKCYWYHLNKNLTNKIIELASGWTDCFHPKVIKKKKDSSRIVGTTPFPKLLKLTSKEKSIKPEATVAYRNPPTLSNNLLNYKQLAFQINYDKPGSFPCVNCALYGNYGQLISMVQHTKIIRCNTKYLNLKQKLNCKNYGIYVGEC